jgi:ubiquinone/menaquinone biosynthesis C-methylase UbiE
MDMRISRKHQARLDLVEGLKVFVAGQLMPTLRQEFEGWCAAEDPSEEQLRNSQFMQTTLGANPLYQASRGLQRLSQEAMWQEVIYGLEQRRPDIEEQLDREDQAAGSLTLNPDLMMPDYYDNTEFHLQPGNFHKNTLAGPVYEIGVATYTMHRYGKAGDEMGRALVSVLPDRHCKRVLYMGCGPAYKGYPLIDALPEAEHWGIDLAAPMLKFARHRAIEHEKPMHFSQMNAEEMTFPDGHFDLIYCMLLLHEVPTRAIENIVNEAARVLAPGGVLANLELPSYASLDPLSAFLMDWDTEHNGEPFWRDYHQMDLKQTYRDAGLETKLTEAHSEWGGAKGNYMGKFRYHVTMGRKPEA